tara:strand:+ start:1617 stop:2468 length:852 start_codon:yes stop_codon:yes gene_type:complete
MEKVEDIEELQKIAADIRIESIKLIAKAGSGHPGGSLSTADIYAVLYWNILNFNPKNPKDPNRDYFILSKGHGCPAWYATLALKGAIPMKELQTDREFGSRLQGHPDKLRLPFVELSTGSLGQGLSVAVGIALGLKLKEQENRVYCILGDGEIDEGNIWEAAMFAPMHKLNNIVGIVDRNQVQQEGLCKDILDTEPLDEKFRAFGWHCVRVNGHSVEDLKETLNRVERVDKPVMIIADTIKGKGVSFMELNPAFHGKAPDKKETKDALKELTDTKNEIGKPRE